MVQNLNFSLGETHCSLCPWPRKPSWVILLIPLLLHHRSGGRVERAPISDSLGSRFEPYSVLNMASLPRRQEASRNRAHSLSLNWMMGRGESKFFWHIGPITRYKPLLFSQANCSNPLSLHKKEKNVANLKFIFLWFWRKFRCKIQLKLLWAQESCCTDFKSQSSIKALGKCDS